MNIFFLGQAGVAAATAILLAAVAVRSWQTHAIILDQHTAVLAWLVCLIAVGNVVTSAATAIGWADLRDDAGLLIRLLLLTIAAYSATLVHWRN